MPSFRVLLGAFLGANVAIAGHSNVHQERALQARGGKALIPDTCFNSQQDLETYFAYNYPWGNTHNGAALMSPSQVSIIHNAYLQLRSDYTGPQQQHPSLSYNSGTIHAKQHFTVAANGGLDFQANIVVPVDSGAWPAIWFDGVNSWPPEIDFVEFKSKNKISFNTFNTSNVVTAKDFSYPTPATAWHTILVQLRPEHDGTTLKADFYINKKLYTTQYGAHMVGQPFYLIIDYQMLGSSGSSGPQHTTYFDVQYLSVTSYNP